MFFAAPAMKNFDLEMEKWNFLVSISVDEEKTCLLFHIARQKL